MAMPAALMPGAPPAAPMAAAGLQGPPPPPGGAGGFQNFAADPDLSRKALDTIRPMLQRARRNRLKIDQAAKRRYWQWALVIDERYYQGRANAYIPAVRRGVEKSVTAMMRETFPNDQWFDLQARADEFEPNVAGMKALLTVQLDRMKVKQKSRAAYRQLEIYGLSPNKCWWRHDPRTGYDGPDFKVIDFFSFGVWPETIDSVAEAALTYEDILFDVDELRAQPQLYDEAALARAKQTAGSGAPSGSTALLVRLERMRRLGITESELNDANFLFGTECYAQLNLDGQTRWWVCTLGWESEVLRLHPSIYRHPPYFVMRYADMPDEWFAHAPTEATDRLQIILNDVANQDLDAASFANNPVMVVDPAYCEDYQAIALFPGAKIPADPDKVKFDRPPEAAFGQKEKTAYLYQLILENLGSAAGSSPSPGATGTPRGARTFGGMQMLQALSGSETKEVVEYQEDAVWEPMLGWMAEMNAKLLATEEVLRIAGRAGAPVVVNRETFVGDYAYQWLGTTTMQSRTLASAQMLVFLNIVRGIPPSPQFTVNLPKILRDWWRAQGLRDPDDVIIEHGRQRAVPPQLEHQLLLVGRQIEVAPADNDAEHIVGHQQFMQTPEGQAVGGMLQPHVQAHVQAYMMKQTLQMQMAAQPALAAGGGNGGPPRPAPTRAGARPSLNPQTGMGPARAMMDAPVGM